MTIRNGVYKVTKSDHTYSFEKIEGGSFHDIETDRIVSVENLKKEGYTFEEMLVVRKETIKEQNDKILGMIGEMNEVEQILGSVLGYPRYVDDPQNFPRAKASDGICVGEVTSRELAEQAKEKIEKLKEENEKLVSTLVNLSNSFVEKVNEQETELMLLKTKEKNGMWIQENIIEEFLERVKERALRNIEESGITTGAHWNALRQVAKELGVETDI